MDIIKLLLSFLIVLLGVVVIGGLIYFVCYLEEKRGIDEDFVLYYAFIDILLVVTIIGIVYTVYNNLFIN